MVNIALRTKRRIGKEKGAWVEDFDSNTDKEDDDSNSNSYEEDLNDEKSDFDDLDEDDDWADNKKKNKQKQK